jgi:hypothetical protein
VSPEREAFGAVADDEVAQTRQSQLTTALRACFQDTVGEQKHPVTRPELFAVNGRVRGLARLRVPQAERQVRLTDELPDRPAVADEQRRRVAARDPAQLAGGRVEVAQQRGGEPRLAELPGDDAIRRRGGLGQRSAGAA